MRRRSTPFMLLRYEEIPRTVPEEVVEKAPSYFCDLCDKPCEGEPAGHGLLMWWRGSEMRYDEPPLCEECAGRITMGAASKWALEDEEEN